MKKMMMLFLVSSAISSTSFAAESLDIRASKECQRFAIDHVLQVEAEDWGRDQVSLLSIDRSIPMGVTNGANGDEISGDANFEITIARESADPIVHEMRVTATPVMGSKALNCKITKEVSRVIL